MNKPTCSEESAVPTNSIHTVELVSSEVTILPSDLLSNKEWVRNITNLMSLVRTSIISKEEKDKADKLVQHTASHLPI